MKSKTIHLILTLTIIMSCLCLSACDSPQSLQDIQDTVQQGKAVYHEIQKQVDEYSQGQGNQSQDTYTQPNQSNDTLTIASFNIQVFGKTKSSKPEVMTILAKTIKQFDVVAIQEIRDKSGTAIELLESYVDNLGTDYEYIIGPRLGRTSSKEQYAFIYNTNTVEPVGTGFTLDDPDDIFHREPFIGHFRSKSGSFDFTLLTLHVDPDEAKKELNAIPEAIRTLEQEETTRRNFIILGDLNADCSYWNENSITSPLRSENFTWLIDNNADTNLASSDCTYDRIIITSQVTKNFTGKAGVFHFDEVFSLKEEEAKDVSDHYPVWAIFRTE